MKRLPQGIKLLGITLFVLIGFFFFADSASAKTLDITWAGTSGAPASFSIWTATGAADTAWDTGTPDVCSGTLTDTDAGTPSCTSGSVAPGSWYRIQVIVKEGGGDSAIEVKNTTDSVVHRDVKDDSSPTVTGWAGASPTLPGNCAFHDFASDDTTTKTCAAAFVNDDSGTVSNDVAMTCSDCAGNSKIIIADPGGEQGFAYTIQTDSSLPLGLGEDFESYFIDHLSTAVNEQSSKIGITGPAAPTFTLNAYRWYVDSDTENVTDPWGVPDIAQDTAIPEYNDPPGSAVELRLRTNFTVNTGNLIVSSQQFILQYKAGTDADCTTGSWTDVDAGGGAGIWRYATSSVAEGTTLTASQLSPASDVLEVYTKVDPTTTNPSSATVGQEIEYDFHIENNGAAVGTEYSFRVLESDSTVFDAYTHCPSLITDGGTVSKTFTISTWVKPETSIATKALAVKNNEIRLVTDASGNPLCQIHNGTAWQTAATSGTALFLNKWQHVVCAYDRANIAVYVDAQQTALQSMGNINIQNTSNDLELGNDAGGTYGDYQGYMDDFRYYNYARVAGEIRLDYNAGFAAKFGGSPNKDVTRGLVGYWNFEEGSGTTAQDQTDNNNDGTLTTMDPNTDWVSGNPVARTGGALDFNAGNERVVLPANMDIVAGVSEVTLSAWIKPTTISANNTIVALSVNGDPASSRADLGITSSDEIRILGRAADSDSSSNFTTNTSLIAINTWYHVVGIIDYANATLSVYVDGQLQGSGPAATFTLTTTSNTTSDSSTIGIDTDGSNSDFIGQIDEVRIYNRALSAEEVRYLYNKGGPIGHWKFDEGSGGTAYDSSGNGNYGTLSGYGVGPGVHLAIDGFGAGGTWVAPAAGEGNTTVETWGAGGGGTIDTGGGGGGAYARSTVAVTPGDSYAVAVGTSAVNTDGGDSTFDTTVVVAKGGLSGGNGGTGGTAAASTGDVKFSGGNGEQGTGAQSGGGGAGNSANASGSTGGAVDGGTAGAAGSGDGSLFGGAGGSSAGSASKGALGHVRITYEQTASPGYPTIAARSHNRDTTGVTSHPITMPAGIVAGDLLIIVYTVDGDDDGGSDHTISAGNWTRLVVDSNSTAVTAAIFYKIAEGGDTATVTTTDTEWASHIVLLIKNGGTPTATSATGNSSNANPPSHNAGSSQKYLWIATGGWDSFAVSNGPTAVPSGYSDFMIQPSGSSITGALTAVSTLFTEVQTEDPGTWTSQSEDWVSFTIAVPFDGQLPNTLTWVSGRFGTALDFGGPDGFVSVGDIGSTAARTLSFWAKPQDTTEQFMQLSSSDSVEVSSGNVTVTGFGAETVYVDGLQTAVFPDAGWHHVVVISDTALTANDVEIGRVGSTYYTGQIDDVRVYDYARTAEEIRLDYNAGFAAKFGGSPNKDVTRGLVGYWNFEDGSGVTALDQTDNANDGTLTNMEQADWISGKAGLGGALGFDGSNEHVLRADDADFDFAAGASFSLSGWIKHNTQAAGQDIILSKFNEAGYKILMEADGDITCGIDYDSTWTPTDSVTSTLATYDDNTWHHVACVKDANTSLTLYIDGISVGTPDTTLTNSTLANADPLYMGIDADGTSNAWLGQLDEMRIYNRAITAEEVRYLYNKGGPIGHWKFDEGSGTTAFDSTDNNNDGTLTNMEDADWVSGKYGTALDFDGSNEYVSAVAGDGSDFDLVGSDFTLSAWFQTGTTSLDTMISSHEDGINDNYRLDVQADGTVRFQFTTGPSDTETMTSTETYNDNKWHHAVGVRNGPRIGALYVDGLLVAQDTDNSGSNAAVDTTTFNIGRYSGGGGTNYFDGLIDDVRIYNYVRTAEEIRLDYNAGLSTHFR